jgi:hypothetical protein
VLPLRADWTTRRSQAVPGTHLRAMVLAASLGAGLALALSVLYTSEGVKDGVISIVGTFRVQRADARGAQCRGRRPIRPCCVLRNERLAVNQERLQRAEQPFGTV